MARVVLGLPFRGSVLGGLLCFRALFSLVKQALHLKCKHGRVCTALWRPCFHAALSSARQQQNSSPCQMVAVGGHVAGSCLEQLLEIIRPLPISARCSLHLLYHKYWDETSTMLVWQDVWIILRPQQRVIFIRLQFVGMCIRTPDRRHQDST